MSWNKFTRPGRSNDRLHHSDFCRYGVHEHCALSWTASSSLFCYLIFGGFGSCIVLLSKRVGFGIHLMAHSKKNHIGRSTDPVIHVYAYACTICRLTLLVMY